MMIVKLTKRQWKAAIGEEPFHYSRFRRYWKPLLIHFTFKQFIWFQDWTFVDTICAIEYVKYFHATFELGFDANDQVVN